MMLSSFKYKSSQKAAGKNGGLVSIGCRNPLTSLRFHQ